MHCIALLGGGIEFLAGGFALLGGGFAFLAGGFAFLGGRFAFLGGGFAITVAADAAGIFVPSKLISCCSFAIKQGFFSFSNAATVSTQ